MVSQQAAAEELLKRRKARSGLLNFTNYTFPQYRAERVHDLIAARLDRVLAGECKRLMIFAPPQHGKSELASVRMPAYWLGRRPDDPVIISSYAASLAYSKSRQARAIVESGEFARVFGGVTTRADSRAVDHWEISGKRGGLLAVGVGGPVTGHGALLGLIDDPFENWEQAQSATIRDKVWEWWRTTFRTRIWEHGAIVLIMTRWNEDDIAGRLIAEQGDRWEILRLPAIAESQEERDANNQRLGMKTGEPDPLGREAGEPLAPGRYSREALESLRRDVGELGWWSEYQGVPRSPEGGRIKRSMLEIVEAAPAYGRRVRYWDKAGTGGGGKRTAGVLITEGPHRIWYIEDMVTGQWEAAEREDVIRQTAQMDAQRYDNAVEIGLEQEPGSGGKESAQNSIKMLAGYPVFVDKVTGEKSTRWEPVIAQMQAGNVKLVRGTWIQRYIDELTAIPNGTFKDQMDATAGGFNRLALGSVTEVGVNPLGDYRG